MFRHWCLFLFSPFVLLLVAPAARGEGRIFTLWPAVDYRASAEASYASLHLLGPLFKFERKGDERELSLRPLFTYAWDSREDLAQGDLLYPIGSRKRADGASSFQGLRLLQSDFGLREMGSDNEFMLFPFLFYGETPEEGTYFAFFPVGGKLLDKFGQDEIRFALFPLYGRTEKKGTRSTHLLWPFFGRTQGENEWGIRIWPLTGASEKTGSYYRRFFLWPVFFEEKTGLEGDHPVWRRGAFPFYLAQDSPAFTARTVLWPFFSYRQDRERDWEEWNFPWPLLRVTRGSGREGTRVLPLWSDERTGGNRKRWYLWPVYKTEELQTEQIARRRDRILFFLFSHLDERKAGGSEGTLRRTSLWPLFTWEERNGVTRFHTLSLLEPFFPDSRGIERNWSPLWRVYQRHWDRQGNEISTLLWNLYWKEKRGEALATELFPLFSYRRQEQGRDLKILKGLLRFRRSDSESRLSFFFLPWGITWHDSRAEQAGRGHD